MGNSADHSQASTEGFELYAQQITGDAQETGVKVADLATMQMEHAYSERLTKNVSVWVDLNCGPEYRQTGSMMGRFYNAGRRQSSLEVLAYMSILGAFVGVALWVVGASFWLYPIGFVVITGISLVLSLISVGR